jgi:hypothetical protein
MVEDNTMPITPRIHLVKCSFNTEPLALNFLRTDYSDVRMTPRGITAKAGSVYYGISITSMKERERERGRGRERKPEGNRDREVSNSALSDFPRERGA